MSNENKLNKIYPYFFNGRFYNYPKEKKPGFLLPSLYMLFKSYFLKKSDLKTDLKSWSEQSPIIESSQDLNITWIGHATFLIQIGGFNILTDPVFDDLSFLFKRITPAGISIDNLPNIDYVIISHNHRDHMDYAALNYLKQNKNTIFLVGQGDKIWYDKLGFENVYEHMWWDETNYISKITKNSIKFTFLPAYHWTQRGLFDYNKSLWGSWMITCNNKNIYFAGDTAYSGHFKNIASHFDKIDVAFMPIGPCEPNKYMHQTHINAEEAGRAFMDLSADHFIPMHWGTYYFGTDRFIDPYNRILSWWSENIMEKYKKFQTLKFGQRISIIEEIIAPEKVPQIEIISQNSKELSQEL